MQNHLGRCRPWIEAALAYNGGECAFEDVVAGIEAGKMQLWPAPKGCLVTEIVEFPQKKVISVFLGGGDLDQLADMHRDVIAWAKAQGCTGARIIGRRAPSHGSRFHRDDGVVGKGRYPGASVQCQLVLSV